MFTTRFHNKFSILETVGSLSVSFQQCVGNLLVIYRLTGFSESSSSQLPWTVVVDESEKWSSQ